MYRKSADRIELIIIVVFLALQLPYFFRGLSRGHRWRQADTAAVARNFLQESPNFFKPRINQRGEKTGITAMEFPFYNYLVHLIYRLTGNCWFGWGQLVSLFFSFGCLIVLSKICKQLNIKLNYKFSLTFGLLFNCLFFDYSTKFMPETTALFFGLLGVWFFFEWTNLRNFRCWIFSWLFFLIAILVRPYIGVLCSVILIYALKNKFDIKAVLLGILILIPFGIWYFVYCPYLVNEYGSTYFSYRGCGLKEGIKSYLTMRLWSGLLDTLLQDLISWAFLPFFVAGLLLIKKRLKNLNYFLPFFIVGIPLIALFGLPSIIGTHYVVHRYYLFATIPSFSLLTALGIDRMLKKWRNSWKILLGCLIIVFLGNNFHTYKIEEDIKNLKKLLPEIDKKTTSKQLFLVEMESMDPSYLYIINRKGWLLSKETIQNLAAVRSFWKKGAKFILRKKPEENNKFELLEITEYLKQGVRD